MKVVARDEVRDSLDRLVAAGLSIVAAGISLLAVGVGLSDLAFAPDRVAGRMSATALASAVLFVAMFVWMRWHPPDPSGANAIAGAMALILLAEALARVAISREAGQATYLMLLVVGSSVVFLSWRWLLGFLTAAVVGWAAVAAANAGREWGHASISLAVALGLAIMLHAMRLSTLRRSEEQRIHLSEAQERYRTLVEQIPAVTYVWKPKGPGASEFFYASPQIESLLGYTPKEWNQDDDFWLTRVHPRDKERVKQRTEECERTGEPFRMEYRCLRKDGELVWVSDEAVALPAGDPGKGIAFQGVMFDITQRKLEGEALAKSRVQLEEAQGIAHLGSFDMDLATMISDWSPEMFRILGLDPATVTPGREALLSAVHPDDRQMVDRSIEVAMSTCEGFGFDVRVIHPDGQHRIVRREGRVAVDADDRPVRIVGTMQDVTERKEAEARLAEAEERFRSLVEEIPAVTYVDRYLGPEAEHEESIYVSPQLRDLLGCDPEEWLTQRDFWPRHIHPDDRERTWAKWLLCLKEGRSFEDDYRMVREDGRVVWVSERSVHLPRRAEGSAVVLGVIFDITEQRKSAELLRESEAELLRSLEVLKRADEERRRLLARIMLAEEQERERLAEGIEDESIQHMTAVGIRLATLKRGLSDERQLGAVDQLGQTVDQAVDRLRHLLVELRPRALEADGLAAALRLYLRAAGSDAGFETSLDDRLTSELDQEVRATAYRITQEALTNVRLHAEARHVDVSLEDCDGGVAVRVADDGLGFDPEGRGGDGGMSVGLVTMRERAELSGGWLRVRSAPHAGTTVDFWLPGGAAGARS